MVHFERIHNSDDTTVSVIINEGYSSADQVCNVLKELLFDV